MKVMEYMNTHVTTLTPDSTIQDAVDKMDLYQVTALPVVDGEGMLIGIVTEHDVVKVILKVPECQSARVLESQSDDAKHSIREIMTQPALAIEDHRDLLDALRLMLQHNIKRLPVTSEGKLVGILTRIDVCQALLEAKG